jgi:ribosomal protein L29
MAKKKAITDLKEIEKKVNELKIEMLKQPTKKKSIKKEVARLLTEKNKQMKEKMKTMKTKSGEKE